MKRVVVVLVGMLLGCEQKSSSPSAPPTPTPIAKSARPLVETAMYRIHAATPLPCKAKEPCEARAILTALGDYKVNTEYPTKFVGEPAPGVAIETESKFVIEEKQRGTLTLRFRADATGPAKLTGQFKLSVCTEENCEIEAPTITLEVPVS